MKYEVEGCRIQAQIVALDEIYLLVQYFEIFHIMTKQIAGLHNVVPKNTRVFTIATIKHFANYIITSFMPVLT